MPRPFVLTAFLLVSSTSALGQFRSANIQTACATMHQTGRANVDGYLFKTFDADDDGSCLEVFSNDKLIFRRTLDSPNGFTLGQAANPQVAIPKIPNGTDLTGRGRPDMIVTAFTVGAHCCMYHLVFELAPAFKLLALLSDRDDDLAHFELDPEDGHYYFHTADWTSAYWPSCFACSPSAEVVLRFVNAQDGGAFHLALDKMKKPTPSQDEWDKEIREVRRTVASGDVIDIGHDLWGIALNLIYSGHSDLAWKFVKEAGPEAQQGHFPPLSDFCSILKASPYWHDLRPTLRDTPPACANAKPAPAN